jgi:hypothetical protein
MNDSIQSTLYGKNEKDSWKTVKHLQEELEDIENLISYDKRPVALANYDKRKKQLVSLIDQKKTVHGSDETLQKQASKNKFQKVSEKKEVLEESSNMLKSKSALNNKRREENSDKVDVVFSSLINTKKIF